MIELLFKVLYRKYRDKILPYYFHHSIDQPWMTYEEMIIIEEVLKKFKPNNCLEWGVGFSTLYFPHFAGRDTKWLGIEHDKDWTIKIKKMNNNPNVTISYVVPNNFPWTDAYNDGAFLDLKDYIDFPSKFGLFDFILVDGRARKDCLIKAYDLVKNDGIVILHDAERKYYHQPLELFKYKLFFSKRTKNRIRLWIGSKGVNINKYFDVNSHLKLTKLLESLGWYQKG